MSAIGTWTEKAAGLDKYTIPTRYPNGLPDLTPGQVYQRADAETGIAMASYLLEAARQIIESGWQAPGDPIDSR